jgi:hypothetical protein
VHSQARDIIEAFTDLEGQLGVPQVIPVRQSLYAGCLTAERNELAALWLRASRLSLGSTPGAHDRLGEQLGQSHR